MCGESSFFLSGLLSTNWLYTRYTPRAARTDLVGLAGSLSSRRKSRRRRRVGSEPRGGARRRYSSRSLARTREYRRTSVLPLRLPPHSPRTVRVSLYGLSMCVRAFGLREQLACFARLALWRVATEDRSRQSSRYCSGGMIGASWMIDRIFERLTGGNLKLRTRWVETLGNWRVCRWMAGVIGE